MWRTITEAVIIKVFQWTFTDMRSLINSHVPIDPHTHTHTLNDQINSSLPPGWITHQLIVQAADLWCNLVPGGRASHTKRQKDQQ